MFELFGYAIIRMVGYGWLWGSYRWKNMKEFEEEQNSEAFGNGGALLIIGMTCSMLAPLLFIFVLSIFFQAE